MCGVPYWGHAVLILACVAASVLERQTAEHPIDWGVYGLDRAPFNTLSCGRLWRHSTQATQS